MYLFVAILCIILSPFLFISVNITNRSFFDINAYLWSKLCLLGFGYVCKVDKSNKVDKNSKYIIISNHGSIIDIMLSYVISPTSVVFIGKKELTKIPLFGYFYKKTNIVIDRKNLFSRTYVYRRSKEFLSNNNVSILIFPEGGIPKDSSVKLGKFKDGAFNLSIDTGIPLLPITFGDNKRKFPKSIKKKGSPGILRVKIHDPNIS